MVKETKDRPTKGQAERIDAADMRGLWEVLPGKFLHVPRTVEGLDRVWAKPGGVVDADDPFVRKHLEGQEYKLRRATTGESGPLTPLPPRMAALKTREERRSQRKKELPPAAKKAVEKSGAAGISEGIAPADDEADKE